MRCVWCRQTRLLVADQCSACRDWERTYWKHRDQADAVMTRLIEENPSREREKRVRRHAKRVERRRQRIAQRRQQEVAA